eukprot:gene3947-5390_t
MAFGPRTAGDSRKFNSPRSEAGYDHKMSFPLKRALLLGSSAVVGLACLHTPALAQTQLPAVEVTAPSPIVRRKPVVSRTTTHAHVTRAAPNRTAAPVPVEAEPAVQAQQGELPIVTDQFATVTVVLSEEIRRSGANTMGELLASKPGISASGGPQRGSGQLGLGHAADRQQREQIGIALPRAEETEPQRVAHQVLRLYRNQLYLLRQHAAHAPWQQRATDAAADQIHQREDVAGLHHHIRCEAGETKCLQKVVLGGKAVFQADELLVGAVAQIDVLVACM